MSAQCGPDCWLMKDDPNVQHVNIDDHNTKALLTSSQLPLPPPAEARKTYTNPYVIRGKRDSFVLSRGLFKSL
jgi:hypothetical protein